MAKYPYTQINTWLEFSKKELEAYSNEGWCTIKVGEINVEVLKAWRVTWVNSEQFVPNSCTEKPEFYIWVFFVEDLERLLEEELVKYDEVIAALNTHLYETKVGWNYVGGVASVQKLNQEDVRKGWA